MVYFVNRYAGLLGYMPILYQFVGPVNDNVGHSTSVSRLTSNITSVTSVGVSEIGWLSRWIKFDTVLFPGFVGADRYRFSQRSTCVLGWLP